MIERARRVLPRMVMTLLLSSPAMAATSHDAKASHGKPEHGTSAPTHHPVSVAKAKPARAKEVGKMAGKPVVASRVRAVGRPKFRETIPAVPQENGVRMIRRASMRSEQGNDGHTGEVRGALIDDGTLWRESGNKATWQQTGIASWYGGKHWQGNKTSSGSRYDENALTAAHATLPLGTKVRVVRNDGRSVIVTINDRPGTRTRIIDLSREAARALGILDAGVAMVTLQPL